MSEPHIQEDVREAVKQKYRDAAKRAASGGTACCGGGAERSGCDPISKDLYTNAEKGALPEKALAASLGCGNPTALAQLQPGETVLDLGSGGGIDVIISNCVIQLSGDKDRVLAEAFRVLKPGGRLAISDVVVRGEVPAAIRKSMELWVGCIAGALEENEYREKLARAGFASVDVEPTRVYRVGEAGEFLQAAGLDPETVGPQIDGKFTSAFVRAVKPAAKSSCCAPTSC